MVCCARWNLGGTLLLIGSLFALPLQAATFTVNSTLHGTDADAGPTELVEAINPANAGGASTGPLAVAGRRAIADLGSDRHELRPPAAARQAALRARLAEGPSPLPAQLHRRSLESGQIGDPEMIGRQGGWVMDDSQRQPAVSVTHKTQGRES